MVVTNPQLSPRKAVFFHVMKTGGMTFRKILASIYEESFHVCEDPSIEAVSAALAKYDCIEFHTLPFKGDFVHMHAELIEQNRLDLLDGCDVFTMLREPVDQVVSQYFYTLKNRAFIEPTYKVNGIPFPGSLEEYLEGPYHFNNQLAFLLAKYPLTSTTPLNRDDLEAAKQMLTRLRAHVGLTERFADSLHFFEQVTGRRVPGNQVLNQNTNPDRPPLEAVSASIREGIRERSALDIELYEFGRELFFADFARYGSAPQYSFVDPHAKPPESKGVGSGTAPAVVAQAVSDPRNRGGFWTYIRSKFTSAPRGT